MAADDNSVGICKKALKVSLYELFYCCECTIKPPMNLALKLFNTNLSRIEIPQPILQPLGSSHRNQYHPVIVRDKGLAMGVTVVQKMNAFRGYTVFLLSVTFGVIGHYF